MAAYTSDVISDALEPLRALFLSASGTESQLGEHVPHREGALVECTRVVCETVGIEVTHATRAAGFRKKRSCFAAQYEGSIMPVTSQAASLASTLPSKNCRASSFRALHLLSVSSTTLARRTLPGVGGKPRRVDDEKKTVSKHGYQATKGRPGFQAGCARSAGRAVCAEECLLLIGQLGRVDYAAGIGAAREANFHRQLPRHPYGMSPRERSSQTEEQRQLVSESGTPMLTSDNRSLPPLPSEPQQQASCSPRGNHRLRPPRAAETSRKAK